MGAIVLLAVVGGAPAPAHANEPAEDPFLTTTSALESARSDKVRAQAALVLGRRGEARAAPYLIRALGDPSPAVRAVAARALGQIGDASARQPLQAAAHERDAFVRRAALLALGDLDERVRAQTPPVRSPAPDESGAGKLHVRAMGDKTHRASPRLREDMRRFVADEFQSVSGRMRRDLSVDGAIKVLNVSSGAARVGVTCGVELILSAGTNGAIIVMSTGEATVERHRRAFHAAMQTSMEQEALAHAVRGAADELRQHIAAHAP